MYTQAGSAGLYPTMTVLPSPQPDAVPVDPGRTLDAAGFDAFYRREHASVHRDVLLICGSRTTADDITQDAFARAWSRWTDVSAMERPGGWVRTAAVRAAVRHKQRTPDWAELRDLASNDPSTAEIDVALVDALGTLSPQQRAAIVLTVIDERPAPEVAALLQCSTATVRVHLMRARRALARIYRPEVTR